MSFRHFQVASPQTNGSTRLKIVLHAGAETAPKAAPKIPKKAKPFDPDWKEKEDAAAAKRAVKQAAERKRIIERKGARDAKEAANKAAEDQVQREAASELAILNQAEALIYNSWYPHESDPYGKGAKARRYLRARFAFAEKDLENMIYKKMYQFFGGTIHTDTAKRAIIERIALALNLDLNKLENDLLYIPIRRPAPTVPATVTPSIPQQKPVPADTPLKLLTPSQREEVRKAEKEARMQARAEALERDGPTPWEHSASERRLVNEYQL